MSRTLKDTRANKELRQSKTEEPTKRRYQKAKQNGFHVVQSDEDLCPECGGLVNFNHGFLTCTECNWSTFETDELNFFDLKFDYAI